MAPTSTTNCVPLGVELAWLDVGRGSADVLVLAGGGVMVANRVGVGWAGPACSVAARAVTVMAAAVYTSGVTVWLWPEGRLHAVPAKKSKRIGITISFLSITC